MISFCNLVCEYVHKLCEEKSGGYKSKKLFLWLGQKNKINAYSHDADNSD